MNKALIAAILFSLIVGIGGGYVFSYGELSGLQSRIRNLESEISLVTTNYDNLSATHNQLMINYSNLSVEYNNLNTSCCNYKTSHLHSNSEFNQLLSDHNQLQMDYNKFLAKYNTLHSDYDSLNSTYYGLQGAYELLNGSYNSLNSTYNELQSDYEEAQDRIAELEQMIEYGVDVLLDDEYYYSVKNDLENANDTILVAMYSMIYDPDDTFDWANDLIRELVYAKDRGVNVTVIIEYRTYWDYMHENLEAYDYLSANNVTVRLDEDTETDHVKLVIIDDIVYVGSHNWSESGLYYDRETSVKIVSEDIAQLFNAYFTTI